MLDRTWFQQEKAYGEFKDLLKRTAADRVLRVKHLILPKILNIMGINADLL